MKTIDIRNYRSLLMSAALLLGAGLGVNSVLAAESGRDHAALMKVLPQSKHSLMDGLRQATRPPEVPISAKFEFDDAGKLSLSVYTAEKGISVDPEKNVLKELSGSPAQDKWTPEVEVFTDVPHVARSSQQLTLMSISRFTLVDIVAKAQKEHGGTVLSVAPMIRDRKPVFGVLMADKGKVTEFHYGVLDGNSVPVGR
jgi:hypothetical protein